MKHQDVKTLQGAGTVLPESATKPEILSAVADTIAKIGPSTFKSLRNVEGATLSALRAVSVAGTVLEPIAVAASVCGRNPVDTVGGLMDQMNLTQADINALACHCANGDELSAAQAAQNLRNIASGKTWNHFIGWSG